ncbi:MAG: NADH-quinone oxidoreductase subunit M [Pirellulales bacterium]
MSYEVAILSLIVFLPSLGALGLLLVPRDKVEAIRLITLAVTLAVFALTVYVAIPADDGEASIRFEMGQAAMQNVFNIPWIPSFNIYYFMGMDGISFPLVILTTFLSVLSFWASWSVKTQVKGFCILFLLLETGMLGVFLALDFFLFYIFWEVMLLPMYFLIGVWGGPRREYAAIKFFLYTLLGSVFMLIAILMLYFASDLRQLDEPQLAAAHVANVDEVLTAKQAAAEGAEMHTFNLLALMQMGQHTDLFDAPLLFGYSLQWWAFLLLFIGFVIKVPVVPLHTWLPDAHVEAPTPISMILAGVLLKMGGYGIIRICYPICPDAGFDLAYLVCGIGVLSMVYGAFAAMAQTDFKRLVAYSSVSHMGYVVLGLGVWSAWAPTNFDWRYWSMGVNGAMFQMIGHGVSSAGMFFMVGVIYDRVHHRNLNEFGGLFRRMPLYAGLAVPIFFAGLGLPGLCGFIGEVFVTLSVWNYSHVLAVIAASVVILTAGYILWAIQRVYLGPEYKGPHGDALTPITLREQAIAWPLIVFAILFGVYPRCVFDYMTPTINAQVQELAEWTRDVKTPRLAAEKAAEEAAAAKSADQDRPSRPVAEKQDGTVGQLSLVAPTDTDTPAATPVARAVSAEPTAPLALARAVD